MRPIIFTILTMQSPAERHGRAGCRVTAPCRPAVRSGRPPPYPRGASESLAGRRACVFPEREHGFEKLSRHAGEKDHRIGELEQSSAMPLSIMTIGGVWDMLQGEIEDLKAGAHTALLGRAAGPERWPPPEGPASAHSLQTSCLPDGGTFPWTAAMGDVAVVQSPRHL